MDREALVAWLLENGGPVVRYRTAVELAGGMPSAECERLEAEAVASAPVQRVLGELVARLGHNALHGSRRDCYENAMGRLILLGCRAGMPSLDERTRPFRDWIAGEVAAPSDVPFRGWFVAMVAAFLAMAGYRDDAVRATLLGRLAAIAPFCRAGRYDIYVDHHDYPGYPRAFEHHRLIDPAIYGAHVGRLPSIHDLNGLAALLADEGDAAQRDNLAAVVAYVLHPTYHAFADGYGVVWGGGRAFYALGWDAKVPGFGEPPVFDAPELARHLLPRLMTLARIPTAPAHPWFGAALEHLETFRTARGTYRFPAEYHLDKVGYWVGGHAMGLGEDRRSPRWREIESTFWRLWIGRLAGERAC